MAPERLPATVPVEVLPPPAAVALVPITADTTAQETLAGVVMEGPKELPNAAAAPMLVLLALGGRRGPRSGARLPASPEPSSGEVVGRPRDMASVGPLFLPSEPVARGQLHTEIVVLVGPGADAPERAVAGPRENPSEAAPPGEPPFEVARPPNTEVEQVPSTRPELTVAVPPTVPDRVAENETVATPVARVPPEVTRRTARL